MQPTTIPKPTPGVATDSQGSLAYVVIVSLVAAVGGFLFGFDLNVIAGGQLYIKDYFALDTKAFGFAVSSAILGGLFGPLLGGPLCDRFGRKRTLIIATILFGVSAIGTALPKTIFWFNFFRILCGLGVGITGVASPMFISEIAPMRMRGRLVNLNHLMMVVGALISLLVSYYLAKHLAPAVSWRWMFGSALLPSVALFLLLLPMPDTPRWLAEQGRLAEADRVLTRINGRRAADNEMAQIKASLNEETGSLSELFRPGMRLALLVGIVTVLGNQWTGWSVIAQYMPTVFRMAGFAGTNDAIAQAILYTFYANVGNLVFTVIGIYLVDSLGRKPLYWICSAGMAVSTFLMGLAFIKGWGGLFMLFLMLMVCWPHAIALGPLGWLIMSEIYRTRIRARAMSLCAFILWGACWIGMFIFPLMNKFFEQRFGTPGGSFMVFSFFCILAFLFGLFVLPETKGKSLEEISRSWLKKKAKNP